MPVLDEPFSAHAVQVRRRLRRLQHETVLVTYDLKRPLSLWTR
jgi:ABC-type sulfate/molybdate transport systems ATPase subunit